MSPRGKQAEVDAYDGAIAYMDAEIGRLLHGLEQQRLLENTLLIVTSDHGEQLGEHGLFNHGNSLYRPLVHVPLLMSFPGRIARGVRVPQPVSVKDIPKTVLDIATGSEDLMFPGKSLARYWRPSGAQTSEPLLIEATRRPFGKEQPWYPLPKGNMSSVVSDDYQYIRHADGTEELHHLDKDPEENVNLADSSHAAVLGRFRSLLEAGISSVTAKSIDAPAPVPAPISHKS